MHVRRKDPFSSIMEDHLGLCDSRSQAPTGPGEQREEIKRHKLVQNMHKLLGESEELERQMT
eukprot:10558792-Prorocentrum_lima.AAC.1